MISYLVIRLLILVYVNQSISNEHLANLLDLIRFGKGSSRLEVEDLVDAVAGEDVMASSYALDESDPQKGATQIAKSNICVGAASQHA
jgi:hypothetical protein